MNRLDGFYYIFAHVLCPLITSWILRFSNNSTTVRFILPYFTFYNILIIASNVSYVLCPHLVHKLSSAPSISAISLLKKCSVSNVIKEIASLCLEFLLTSNKVLLSGISSTSHRKVHFSSCFSATILFPFDIQSDFSSTVSAVSYIITVPSGNGLIDLHFREKTAHIIIFFISCANQSFHWYYWQLLVVKYLFNICHLFVSINFDFWFYFFYWKKCRPNNGSGIWSNNLSKCIISLIIVNFKCRLRAVLFDEHCLCQLVLVLNDSDSYQNYFFFNLPDTLFYSTAILKSFTFFFPQISLGDLSTAPPDWLWPWQPFIRLEPKPALDQSQWDYNKGNFEITDKIFHE